MSGRAGRSGGSKEWTPFDPATEAPSLDGTIETNLKFCSWVATQKATGRIDSRDADSLAAIARVEMTGIRTRHSIRELEDLRALVDRQEKAIAKLKSAEQKDRYASVGNGPAEAFGRVRASPDGDPH